MEKVKFPLPPLEVIALGLKLSLLYGDLELLHVIFRNFMISGQPPANHLLFAPVDSLIIKKDPDTKLIA